ncbi:MAG: inverse autotransporter beta domain-containing protein, partial [Leptospiraceae bacterium]|nr:inverse autotransporter beta domain-containing protein [Leptospiraceae bacterium]
MRRLLLSVSALCLLSPSALAEDELQARAEANWRYGQKRSILMTEFWVPIAQDDKSVLYGDLRMMGDDHDNREGNIGIGYRKMLGFKNLEGVGGAHAWLDRRITKRGSKFHQITLGAEWLGETVDLRLNGYLPLSDKKEYTIPNADPQGPAFAGTGIVVDTNGQILEEPQHGFDIELGWELGSQIDFIKDHTDSVRVYGGAYYFDGDNTENVAGWRTRFTADVTENIQFGARFQRDDVRGSQGFLEATFRFPFGHKKSYRKEGIRARLDESPERDIDIVTGEQVTDSGDRVQVLNTATAAAQEVLHVDNTAAGGGDGSAENPFNTLAAAESAASAQTIIYVHTGDGGTTGQDQGVTLDKT